MARRKKYQKLPNGYGSIRFLGSGRRNPYGVYPPVKEFDDDGRAVGRKAICYVDSWLKGFAVLTAYHAGNYTPGMERGLEGANTASVDSVLRTILSDYNQMARADQESAQKGKTFAEVYEEYYSWKYEQDKSRKYSESSRRSTQVAFKNCAVLHGRIFADLRYNDLQKVIDDCKLKYASIELIKTLFRQMYAYAEIQEIVDKDYSAHVRINKPDDDEHGVPFSDADLKKLWDDKEDPVAEMLLIMCYSGYRIGEYRNLTVNLQDWYFQGGSKTAAGKNRIVPIHTGIRSLVRKRIKRDGKLLPDTAQTFRKDMKTYLASHGMEMHTPHDCRHTFSALCERYGVADNDRKRMLGHALGDVTNSVYGHRTVEDLRTEIEKISICCQSVANRKN